MIIRSIIFYFEYVDKERVLSLAKLLNGYVDVEDASLANPHIDIEPFHNVIVFTKSSKKGMDLFNKYSIYQSKKHLYIITNENEDNKIITFYYNNSNEEIAFLINENSKMI